MLKHPGQQIGDLDQMGPDQADQDQVDKNAVDQDNAWYCQVDHVYHVNNELKDHAAGKSGLICILSTVHLKSRDITSDGTGRTVCSCYCPLLWGNQTRFWVIWWHFRYQSFFSNKNNVTNIEIIILGLYSLSGRTSYCKISWNLEAARLGVEMTVSFSNLTDISAALLSMCLSNFGAVGKVWTRIPRLRDFTRSCSKTSVYLMNTGPGLQLKHNNVHHFRFLDCITICDSHIW